MKYPIISIVIPAYNEEKDIGGLLDSLMKLDYPKKKTEIIVIDDGSTDETPKIISEYPVKTIRGKHEGASVARNLGWKSAKSDIIVFLDADMRVHKNFLKEIMKSFHDKSVGGGYYIESFLNQKSLIAKLSYLRKIPAYATHQLTLAKIARKKALTQIGGIKPHYGYYDDWEMAEKIKERGYDIVCVPKAKMWHHEPETFSELYRQQKWAGKSTLSLVKHKRVLRTIGFTFLCALLPLYLLLLFSRYPYYFFGILGLLTFSIIEIQRSFRMYFATKWKESFLTPFFDYVTMVFLAIGIFYGLLHIKSKPKV
jgi:cellulose synthase/poly-beta-1,6-N-acetylglucosamine synthase-like glycosyltransferase